MGMWAVVAAVQRCSKGARVTAQLLSVRKETKPTATRGIKLWTLMKKVAHEIMTSMPSGRMLPASTGVGQGARRGSVGSRGSDVRIGILLHARRMLGQSSTSTGVTSQRLCVHALDGEAEDERAACIDVSRALLCLRVEYVLRALGFRPPRVQPSAR